MSRNFCIDPGRELLVHPLVRVEDLIAARFPLSEAPQAFARAAQRDVLKVLLE
jgi:threonine dehydrogenase-like Zn-dependent dehydrogenase